MELFDNQLSFDSNNQPAFNTAAVPCRSLSKAIRAFGRPLTSGEFIEINHERQPPYRSPCPRFCLSAKLVFEHTCHHHPLLHSLVDGVKNCLAEPLIRRGGDCMD